MREIDQMKLALHHGASSRKQHYLNPKRPHFKAIFVYHHSIKSIILMPYVSCFVVAHHVARTAWSSHNKFCGSAAVVR